MSRARRTGLVLMASLVCTCMASAPAVGAAPNLAGQGRLDQTVRFLQDHQNADGGWGGRPGALSDPGFTAWVAMGLAAGGVNPMDQARPGGVDAYTYLTRHASELKLTTDFERVLLVAVAAGGPVRDFGGVDLVGRILERRLPDGSFAHEARDTGGGINDTAFAVLPFSAIDDPALRPVIDDAVRWLKSVQSPGGGWSFNPNLPLGVSSDMTASVIEALRAAGHADTREELRGWAYLRSTHQSSSGGFAMLPTEAEANTASTAWTVQGAWAAGLEPATAFGTPSPLDFMAAMQDERGMIRWKASTVGDRDNPVWMTAYCAPAFAGYQLPIPRVARAERPADPPPAPTTPDAGVTAGGGGEGAPLFSRPEPQSQGQTPGGIRDATPGDAAAKPRATTKRRQAKDAGGRRAERTTSASNGDGSTTGITRDPAPDRSASEIDATPDAAEAEPQATAGLAGGRGAGSDGAAGTVGPPQVTGDVVGLPRAGADGDGEVEGAAPGLEAAAVDRGPALAAGLGALLVVAVGVGMNLERVRVAGSA